MFFNTTNVPRYFPSQKKSTKEKTEEWCKQCVLAGEQILLYSDPTIRQTRLNKKTNYNLYNDIYIHFLIEKNNRLIAAIL